MQSGLGEGDASPEQQSIQVDNTRRHFSDADDSSYDHIPEALGYAFEAASGLGPPSAALQSVPNSIPNPPSTFPPASSSHDDIDSLMRHTARHAEHLMALRDASSRFSRRYNKFAPSRAEVLLLRSRVEFEWTACADQRRFVSDSQEAFLREATRICTSLPSGVNTDKLAKLLSQVAYDHKRQADHLVKTYDLETQLSDAEYGLQQREFRIAQAAQNIADVINQIDLPDQGASSTSTAPSAVMEDDVPALVLNYFDKAGDVRLEQEKIIELNVEHRQEREKRLLEEDQDIQQAISEQEFEEGFMKQLAEAEMALAEAERKRENAKQVCIDENLDPELYRLPRLDRGAASDQSISDQDSYGVPDSPLPTATPNALPSPLTLALGNLGPVQTTKDDILPSIFEPIQVAALASSLSQGLSSQRRQENSAPPLNDRIRGWMDDFTDETGSGQSVLLSRSKSSDTHSSLLVLEQRQDGTFRVNKAASQTRRQQRRESQQEETLASTNGTIVGQRPPLRTRSSSESRALVLPAWEGSYQEAVNNIRGLAAPKE